MARSISEFIQEQETGIVSTPEVNDNYISAYCECAAALSLANSYTEQMFLASLAVENNAPVSFIEEADNPEKKNIFQKIGGGLKFAWEKFIEFWKGIIRKIKGFFVDKKIEAVNKKLDEIDPTRELTLDVRVLNPYVFIMYSDSVLKLLNDNVDKVIVATDSHKAGKDLTDPDRYYANYETDYQWAGRISKLSKQVTEDISKGTAIKQIFDQMADVSSSDLKINESELPNYEVKDGQKIKITVGELKTVFKFVQSDRYKGALSRLEKRIADIEKEIKAAEKDHAETLDAWEKHENQPDRVKKEIEKRGGLPDKPDERYNTSKKLQTEASINSRVIALLKEILNTTTKLSESMLSTYNTITSDILNNPDKYMKSGDKEAEAKQESFYFV